MEKALKMLNDDNENKKKRDKKEKDNDFLAFIASGYP